jgi:hypothetical protein
VCAASGGPFPYTPTKAGKTNLGLEEAHRTLRISPAEFDEVAAELARTLDVVKVPQREKDEVLAPSRRTRARSPPGLPVRPKPGRWRPWLDGRDQGRWTPWGPVNAIHVASVRAPPSLACRLLRMLPPVPRPVLIHRILDGFQRLQIGRTDGGGAYLGSVRDAANDCGGDGCRRASYCWVNGE